MAVEPCIYAIRSRELAERLRKMAINTGTINCLGCPYDGNHCDVHGCALLKEAAHRLEKLD